jgi:Domain of unknown function (DUF3854)
MSAAERSPATPPLLPHHLCMLRDGSGLSDEIIAERGYRSVTNATELRVLGFSARQAIVPALLIPLCDVTGRAGSYSLRPDVPRLNSEGGVAKYEQPSGCRPILDIPLRCRTAMTDPRVTLYVTEGAKKADALAQRGAAAINLSGVWNWRGTNELGGKTALPDWESIALNGRLVRIVFDSDVTTKLSVGLALLRFKAFLEQRGATVEVVYLSDGAAGEKQGIDDFLVAGGMLDDLDALAADTVRQPERQRQGELPEVVINGRFLPEIANDCWRLIVNANAPTPTAFVRGSFLVGVRRGDDGQVFLREWTPDDVPFVLERLARFVRVGPEEKGFPRYPASVPKRIVADMMTDWNKPVPHIRGLVHTPVFDASGSLNTTVGYQADTKLYYHALGEPVPAVPIAPTPADIATAKRMLLGDWLVDFRFADEASRTHVIAASLTPLVREMISGPTPLFLIDAPIHGSGKGLLAQTLGMIVTGTAPAVTTQPRDQDEERKRITSSLRAASPVILIDNIKQRLDSPILAAALTSEMWTDRLLGASETLRLPNRALWLGTGNNVELDGEIGRRTVPIRIDPKIDRPWERTGFKHNPLLRWVSENRPLLVQALLVMVQHWVASGRPAFTGPTMGSFESWSEIVGGVLECCGIDGLLSNRDELYKRADSETEEWRDFIIAWWDVHGTNPVKAGELARLVRENELLPGLLATVRGELTDQKINTRLGKAIAKRRDRRIGDYYIRLPGRDTHQKGTLFALELAEDAEDAKADDEQPPHDNWSSTDSFAEDAEDAEDDSQLRAKKVQEGHLLGREKEIDGDVPKRPPHPPHPPQLDSKSAQNRAEVAAEVGAGSEQPPQHRCRLCGASLSVVAVSDTCRWCK